MKIRGADRAGRRPGIPTSLLLGLSALHLAFPLPASCQSKDPPALASAQIKNVGIPKIARKPVLEDFVNGAGRDDMKRIDDFRQRQPADGEPASYPTAAWLGYDDKNLYVAFMCHSPADQTRARMAKREDIFDDDWVAVILDTYHDHQRGYEFFVNPLGIQADALEGLNSGEDFSFDTLWYSEARVTPDGYAALMTLPFKSLRFSSSQMQTWGLGLGRHIPPKNETSFWPFITNRISGFNTQLGDASGLESISAGRNLQFIPYGAYGRSHFLDIPDQGLPSYRTKTDFRGGLDAKAVLRDSLTLDVALNPDFSQVESDDPQVTVNQRYEVMFPEKRPFFLENSNYFSTPENLFFSRRIADPEFGARLTGKLGNWSVGMLGIDDRAPGAALAETNPHKGERAAIGVVRVLREFRKESSVGLLVTDREFAGGFNRVAAIDSHFKINENWTLTGQATTSRTRRQEGAGFSGNALYGGISGYSRKYSYDLEYVDRGDGFHTDLGFIPRTGIRELTQFARRTFHPKSKRLLSLGPNLWMRGAMDHRGVQQDWSVNPGFDIEMAGGTFLRMEYSQSFERFNGVNFRLGGFSFGGRTEYLKRVSFDLGYSKNSKINYSAPAAIGPFLGDESEYEVELTIRPTSRLKMDQVYYYTRLATRPDSFRGALVRPATAFINHLARSRLNYQFNRRLSLRMIVDYNAVLENAALVSLERQKRITGDVLLTYLLHPGTALYIGYTDRLENLTLRPGSPPAVYRTGDPNTTTGRGFFMKLSYLLRF
jgi:hypothetical protein